MGNWRSFLAVVAFSASMQYALPASAQELGRLFFTPQQRQDMDRRRSSNAQSVVVTPEDLVTVNGRVSRSSGKTTTWINGSPQEDAHRGPDASRVTIRQGEEAPTSLKVGETLDRVKGETRDGLDGGRLSVRRPKN
jgi:hypothetical protein